MEACKLDSTPGQVTYGLTLAVNIVSRTYVSRISKERLDAQ